MLDLERRWDILQFDLFVIPCTILVEWSCQGDMIHFCFTLHFINNILVWWRAGQASIHHQDHPCWKLPGSHHQLRLHIPSSHHPWPWKSHPSICHHIILCIIITWRSHQGSIIKLGSTAPPTLPLSMTSLAMGWSSFNPSSTPSLLREVVG